MIADPEFLKPVRHQDFSSVRFDGLLIPGGHAPGVKTLLDSAAAQACVIEAFRRDLAVAAICHGPVLLSRSRDPDTGRSVLAGRRTTALTRLLEYAGYLLTAPSHGRYYRTYPMTVESEVRSALGTPNSFVRGPLPLRRDAPDNVASGFALRDGNYVSARWPGDAYRFAEEYVALLSEKR
jgi:putative intracellular protease/amidase